VRVKPIVGPTAVVQKRGIILSPLVCPPASEHEVDGRLDLVTLGGEARTRLGKPMLVKGLGNNKDPA
jgi:hypothetical protein